MNEVWSQMTLTFHLGSARRVRLMAMHDIHPFPAFLDLAGPLAELAGDRLMETVT